MVSERSSESADIDLCTIRQVPEPKINVEPDTRRTAIQLTRRNAIPAKIERWEQQRALIASRCDTILPGVDDMYDRAVLEQQMRSSCSVSVQGMLVAVSEAEAIELADTYRGLLVDLS